MKTIPYGRQTIGEEDIQAVVDVLRSDWLTQGPTIEAFEEALAAYCGARYAVVCASGTAALHLAYQVAGVGAGDLILTSPNTFAATANAALYLGAKPVFSDIDPATYNLNPAQIEQTLSTLRSDGSRFKAIVPVHFAGTPCEMESISKIADRHRLIVIEDACHALGASYAGKKVGGLSDMTVFSFHPVKTITTGEGGAILTNQEEYYQRLKRLRSHGIERTHFREESHGAWYHEIQELGCNYRMTDLQAALGRSQLKKVDRFVARRREIAALYQAAFKGNASFDLPVERSADVSSYHLYPIRLKDPFKAKKKEIFSRLRAEGLGVQVHYLPVYWHPIYQKLGYRKGLCPAAEDFYQREISLPLFPAMSQEEVAYVIETVHRVFREYA
ncbi:MAG: UDP-4-amino-4,6-dideoxy-N-acetyl-beta-L-altrosamine transaminase [Candidatus Manganitrophaceae bacterium]|nr:MAG: UDP-4-amino-4,6-dideoxy-N-acetyl-beta-L-altrosamine transaminase [Candidatus Manganitrophaceae bacterium]